MRGAIIAESHRWDKSQEYLNIHRDNKLTKAEGVFGDLRLMGRGGAGSMCSLVRSQDLIKSFLDMCPVNANSFQNAYFSVFGTVEMPENTKVDTFFFFFLLRKQSARVECRSPRSTCISSSTVPLSVGPRSSSLKEGRRGALQIHPSTPIYQPLNHSKHILQERYPWTASPSLPHQPTDTVLLTSSEILPMQQLPLNCALKQTKLL